MRPILVFLLSVALATSAGCFGKDDGETPPTTSPTPGGTTPTGTTGTTPTGTPPTPTSGTNTTTPAKPAPKQLCAPSFDFATNTPNPGPPPAPATVTQACGDVTTGYAKLTLSGNFSSAAPLVVANGITVSVVDAAGTTVASCAGPGPGPAAVTACAGEGAVVVGTYSILYAGEGNVNFAGVVTIS